VKAAHVSLRCLLKALWVGPKRPESIAHYVLERPPCVEEDVAPERDGLFFVPDSSDLDLGHDPVYVTVLMGWCGRVPEDPSEVPTELAGLAPRPCEATGTIQRVGIFIGFSQGDETKFDRLLRLSPDSADYSSESYDPVTGKHTLRII